VQEARGEGTFKPPHSNGVGESRAGLVLGVVEIVGGARCVDVRCRCVRGYPEVTNRLHLDVIGYPEGTGDERISTENYRGIIGSRGGSRS